MSETQSQQEISLQSQRVLSLGSGCKIEFLQQKNTQKIIPVIMITQIKDLQDKNDISTAERAPTIGIINTEFDNDNKQLITTINDDAYSVQSTDWINFSNNMDKYQIVYPRVSVNSLGLNTDSTNLILKYYDKSKESNSDNIRDKLSKLQPYEDYSILTRSLEEQYVLTLDNQLIIKNNYNTENGQLVLNSQPLRMNYSISNADVSIYLDALQVLKQNAEPKTSYTIKTQLVNPELIESIYNKMGYIAHINDNELKFKNVRGYISGFTLDLDNPSEDTIQIKNYKTKFEDLFSTITAQTEAMKKSSYSLQLAAAAFTPSGTISEQVLETSLRTVDLDYAFNNGKLTIDEENGIWGTSDTGVVAFRGGGIFTATEKKADGNWKWNTGITPQGINADLITSGQLDTNLIKIYAGDHLRFQMNGDGLFAYKSWTLDGLNTNGEAHPLIANDEDKAKLAELEAKETAGTLNADEAIELKHLRDLQAGNSLDSKQYVLFNEQGLSLVAKRGAKVLNKKKTDYITVLQNLTEQELDQKPALKTLQSITRVEVSWEGFILRNWYNDRVFYARPDTGDLVMSGYVYASGGRIGHWNFNDDMLWSEAGVDSAGYSTFVALNTRGSENYYLTTYNRDGDPIELSDGTTSINLGNTKDYAFWAGSAKPVDAPFSVAKTGKIKAISGEIGGWTIQTTKLYSSVLSLASTTTTAEFTDQQFAQQEDGSVIASVPENKALNENVVFWIHGTELKNNERVVSYKAANSLMFIGSTGKLYAQELYFLTLNASTGSVHYATSVRTLIKNAQARADAAYKKAKAVQDKFDAAQWVTSVSLSDKGELHYRRRNRVENFYGGTHSEK